MLLDPNDALIQQLKRIADAIAKPPPSPWLEWLKTIASFIAGLTTAYFSQQFQSLTNDHREQRKLRQIVYLELFKNFMDLDSIVSPHYREDGTPILTQMRFTFFNNNLLTYDGEAYINQNTAVFYQLKEGEVLKWVYSWFHKLDVPKLDGDNKFGLAELRGPLSFFSECYRENPTFHKQLGKLIPRSSLQSIETAMKRYRKHNFSMEEMVDSGLMRIVDDDTDPGNVGNIQPQQR